MRSSGDLSDNETVIPIRIIDQSIRLEQPQYVNYLTEPKRAAVFEPTVAGVNPAPLEAAFTKAIKYNGWTKAYLATVDGAALHGWDSVEIEYSPGRIGGFATVHVGHDNLIFPTDAKKFSSVDCFFIRKFIPASKLLSYVKDFEFDQAAVEQLIGSDSTADRDGTAKNAKQNKEVFKFFFKKNKIVYMGWLSPLADKWLKEPMPYYNGKKRKKAVVPSVDPFSSVIEAQQPAEEWEDVPETDYDFVQIFDYRVNEEDTITASSGKAASDDAAQEALTNLWTAAVNAAAKSANSYASPKDALASAGGKPSVLDLELIPDRVYDTPMNFWSHPGMKTDIIALASSILTQHRATEGQVNYAAQNRQDSRKTATEVAAAEGSQSKLNSVNLLHFSSFLQSCFSYQYSLFKNLSQRGDLMLLGEQHLPLLDVTYTIRPAGEVDVLERDELIQKLLMMEPLAKMYPALHLAITNKLLFAMFGEYGPEFQQALQQSNEQAQTNGGVASFLGDLLSMQNPDEMFSSVQSNARGIEQTIEKLQGLGAK